MDGCPQRLVFLVFILDRIPPNFPGYHGFASIVTPGLWTPRRGVPSYPCGSKSDPTGSERREPLRFVALKGLAQHPHRPDHHALRRHGVRHRRHDARHVRGPVDGDRRVVRVRVLGVARPSKHP